MLLAAVLGHVVRADEEPVTMWAFVAVLFWLVVGGGILSVRLLAVIILVVGSLPVGILRFRPLAVEIWVHIEGTCGN